MTEKKAMPRTPLKLRPEPVERVWGGAGVRRAFGWTPAAGNTVGEWWLLSFRHDHPSTIEEGDFAGIPLPQLVYAHSELLGKNPVPALLIKIVDSAERLSVQVHPDDRLAARLGLDSGKTECWYHLPSDPGAVLYVGLEDGISPDAFFRKATGNPTPGEMEALLRALPVREGALSFIPAGTVHAIGAGVMVLEVQQNSDTTFRIYDWGRPRELHLDEAREAVETAVPESAILAEAAPREAGGAEAVGVKSQKTETLVDCSRFVVKRFKREPGETFPPMEGTFGSVTCLKGRGTIAMEGFGSEFRKGDTYFLPAGCPALRLESSEETLWIFARQGREGS